MEKQEFDKLKKVIKTYADKRNEIYNKIAELDKTVREGTKQTWHADELKNDLYKELTDCEERKAYTEEYKKIEDDDDFEKYFRSAALEYFLGINIKPEHL